MSEPLPDLLLNFEFSKLELHVYFSISQPTAMHLVTPLISYMVNSPDFTKKEMENVHAIIAAAAPIGKSLINRFLEKAEKHIFFQEGYGMTELSPVSGTGTRINRVYNIRTGENCHV